MELASKFTVTVNVRTVFQVVDIADANSGPTTLLFRYLMLVRPGAFPAVHILRAGQPVRKERPQTYASALSAAGAFFLAVSSVVSFSFSGFFTNSMIAKGAASPFRGWASLTTRVYPPPP